MMLGDQRNSLHLVASLALATLMACVVVVSCIRFTSPVEADSCGSSWSIVPSAAEVRIAQAIEPIAPDDIWIVGGGGPKPYTTAAEHWDGTSWTSVPTPSVGTGDNLLTSVSASGSDDVWGVGYSQFKKTGASYATLVEHWNGNDWQVVQSPNVGTQTNALTGVEALDPNLAWAVGYYREGASSTRTLIQRWDGTSWSIVRSPSPGIRGNALLGVTAVAANDIWAVGWKSSVTGIKSLVLHYDGAGWEVVSTPQLGTGDNVLTSVSALGSGEVWAAGYYIDGTQHKTLTLHYDGTAWEHVPSSNAGDGVTVLRDISASSPADAWAVGLEYRAGLNSRYVASSQHWDGSSWTALPSAISSSRKESDMYAVGKAPGTSQVWAAGQPATNVETICPSGSALSARTASSYGDPVTGSTETLQPGSISSPEADAATETVGMATLPIEVTAVDMAAEAGLSEETTTYGALVTDLDGDGLKDIFLSRHIFPSRLYHNDGNGHFSEIDPGSFGQSHNCAAADVNNNALKDIYCTTGAGSGTHAKANMLYIQRPDRTFVDRADRYGVLEPFSRGRFTTFINANNDAQPDLFVGSIPDRGDGLPSINRLFVGEKGTTYRSAPRYGLELGLESHNGKVGDLDKDGWQDLVLVGQDLRVYHNEQGNGFTEVTNSVGLGNHDPQDVALADLNGDTWPDVIEVELNKFTVSLNKGDGTFSTAFSASLTYGKRVAAGDVNGDDRPDIYVMRGGTSATGANAPDLVYLNSGNGTSFAQMPSIPSTSEGKAESVWPIDYDRNGLTDFLVLNGLGLSPNSMGPVQLISFFPSTSRVTPQGSEPGLSPREGDVRAGETP